MHALQRIANDNHFIHTRSHWSLDRDAQRKQMAQNARLQRQRVERKELLIGLVVLLSSGVRPSPQELGECFSLSSDPITRTTTQRKAALPSAADLL